MYTGTTVYFETINKCHFELFLWSMWIGTICLMLSHPEAVQKHSATTKINFDLSSFRVEVEVLVL